MAPGALPVNDNVLPVHNVVADKVAEPAPGDVIADTDGVVTVATVPHALLAAKVYTPAEAVPTVKLAGDNAVDTNPLGPLHE